MRIFFSFVFILIMYSDVYSHTLLLQVEDLDDGNISVTGRFSTGQAAVGAKVRLVEKNKGKIIFEKRITEAGEVIVKIPELPYEIQLDAGPGHMVVKEGIPPSQGFKQVDPDFKKYKKIETITIVKMISALLFAAAFLACCKSLLRIKKVRDRSIII